MAKQSLECGWSQADLGSRIEVIDQGVVTHLYVVLALVAIPFGLGRPIRRTPMDEYAMRSCLVAEKAIADRHPGLTLRHFSAPSVFSEGDGAPSVPSVEPDQQILMRWISPKRRWWQIAAPRYADPRPVFDLAREPPAGKGIL